MSVNRQIPALHCRSKCSDILNEIFEGFIQWMNNEILDLAIKSAEIKKEPIYLLSKTSKSQLFIASNYEKWNNYVVGQGYFDTSLWEEVDKYYDLLQQAIKDALYINQWLSIAITNNSEETRKRLPNFLATMDIRYRDIPLTFCEIPEGKEAVWEKGEKLAKYYLGYKLLI